MRTVIEELRVSIKIDAECATYPRLEEAYDALKWWLAHEPSSGEPITDVWWVCEQKGEREINIPTLGALYSFTEDEVYIASILIRLPSLS